MKLTKLLPALTLSVMLPSVALGIGGNVNHPVEAGPSTAAPETLSSVLEGDDIFIKALADHSYCCQIRSLNFQDAPYFRTVQLLGVPVAFSARGESEPLWDTIEEHLNATKTRVCIMPDSDGSYAFEIQLKGEPNGFVDSATNIKVHCAETTIFGGFNTIVNKINYLELNNTLRSTEITGRLTATNAITGATIVSDYAFTVPAGRRTDLPLHDILGTNIFGNVVIAFDGPAGSLQATVSQYKITSLDPFAFELVSRDRLTGR